MPDSIEQSAATAAANDQNQNRKEDGEEVDDGEREEDTRHIHGLLVSYKDDGIDESIHSALQNKKRVHYKCLDAISNFVALGTSVGAIYLFRLSSITHSSCKLALVIPCDQGAIEVIKFVPSTGHQHQAIATENSLLVVIGTSRGSIVVFQLNPNEESVLAQETYRAEEFTKSEYESSIGIKLIEYDQDLLDPGAPFTKLYICDQKNRIFVLEQSSIYPAFRLLYSHKPAHILSVDESTIHQICVHRSQLLLSTDEMTRLFSEYSNQLLAIGKKQRKSKGFFGACFYNVNYKPARLQAPFGSGGSRMSFSQQTVYSSTASLADLDNLLIFVARPKYSLWQVNGKRDVMFTHMFEAPIKGALMSSQKIIRLQNEPLQGRSSSDSVVDSKEVGENNKEENDAHAQAFAGDDYSSISEAFADVNDDNLEKGGVQLAPKTALKSDHFEKLMPMFSATLGNLLLSYTRHEIYVIDPIGARLIVAYTYEKPIQQVVCSENEIFVMLELSKRQTRVERIILLAPTQFVLELHRLNRFLSLVSFVQLFKSQFKRLMALPLSGPSTITTEGGLLRNIVWNTWREVSEKIASARASDDGASDQNKIVLEHDGFKEIADEIMSESIQLKRSIENLTDSRLFFVASQDNIERLCSEPYASMVSLDISLANLHSNHVVHFSQEALHRHKSLAKLSQSIMNLSQLRRSDSTKRMSLLDLNEKLESAGGDSQTREPLPNFNDKRVIVEPLRPKTQHNFNGLKSDKSQRGLSLNRIVEVTPNQEDVVPAESRQTATGTAVTQLDEHLDERSLVSCNGGKLQEAPLLREDNKQDTRETVNGDVDGGPGVDHDDPTRCPSCKWPRPRAHLKPMHHSQQIQYGWIQENLTPNFEENIEQIEERAFKHGLWHVVLKCLAFNDRLEDYVRLCLMLDDVRLLDAKRFIITRCSEDKLIDLVFRQLEQKLDIIGKFDRNAGTSKNICLKCKHEIVHGDTRKAVNSEDGQSENDDDDDGNGEGEEDDISFNLVGLFKKLLRNSADIKRAVDLLLQYPNLLDKSHIPATFYLEALNLYPRPHRVGTT